MVSLIGKLKGLLIIIASLFAFTFAAIQWGRKSQREDDRVEGLEQYIQTKERIDEVEVSDDRDAAFERLRRNGWVR